MRIVKLSGLLVVCACVVLLSGCADELKDCRIQNAAQQKMLSELESQVKTTGLKLAQLERQLASAGNITGTEIDALKQEIAALKEDLKQKQSLIASMQQQLLFGGGQLPVELSTMLEDFAKNEEMITYDASRGVVKFKSDLLFEPGSDTVASKAIEAIKALSGILNSEVAKKFDVIIAGHTDDMRIAKPATRQKHPTNWHLSAHRGISVLNVMQGSGIVSERMSIRGFGEFRPVAPNKPNKKGNALNRRVEVYIVSKGV